MLEISSDNLKSNPGVYIIIASLNKIYVGESNNIKRRFNEHKYDLNNNKHSNTYLQNIYNKYKDLKFQVLEYYKEKEIKFLEKEWYETFKECGYELINILIPDGKWKGIQPSGKDSVRFKDYTDQIINNYYILRFHHSDFYGSYWEAKCLCCGRTRISLIGNLKAFYCDHKKRIKAKDRVGTQINNWKIKKLSHYSGNKTAIFKAKCVECGKEILGCVSTFKKPCNHKIIIKSEDRIGTQINNWKILEIIKQARDKHIVFKAQCVECGSFINSCFNDLRRRPHNCKRLKKDYTGQIINNWEIISFYSRIKNKESKYKIKCLNCGFEKISTIGNLKKANPHKCKKVKTNA